MFLELSNKKTIRVDHIDFTELVSNTLWVYFVGGNVTGFDSPTDQIKIKNAMDAYGK